MMYGAAEGMRNWMLAGCFREKEGGETVGELGFFGEGGVGGLRKRIAAMLEKKKTGLRITLYREIIMLQCESYHEKTC